MNKQGKGIMFNLDEMYQQVVAERDALREQLRLTNIDQLQCEVERDRYKTTLGKVLKILESLCDTGWNPEIEMIKSALAPEEKA